MSADPFHIFNTQQFLKGFAIPSHLSFCYNPLNVSFNTALQYLSMSRLFLQCLFEAS